ncbi:MAG: site-specific integrase [Flavipsychrobacter sp.]|nr:site-specific integrase [Flavipsychrobacter sp.]
MLEKSFGLLFYLKKPKNYRTGPMPIYYRITVDGIPKEITTKRKCLPERWNADSQSVKGTSEESKSINAYLQSLTRQVFKVKQNLQDANKPITSEHIKNILTGKSDSIKMLLQIFRHHNDQMEALVGKEFSAGTLERYRTSLEHTRSFMRWKYDIEDIDIQKLNFEFVSEYEFWLKSVRNCNHNTAIKYISNFRKIVNRCIRTGWLSRDPFVGFKMSKREVERIALTEDELQSIVKREFQTPRLNLVRDVFLFACFTGLAYADIQKLKKSEIGIGVDGEQWLFTNRQKTETSSRVPLLPITKCIITRYHDHPLCNNLDKVLPVLTNQKMNAYLKEIADLCGITKNLTFHLARHTFATTVTLSNGVPIESVSKMLGHKNIRTTQLYAKVLDRKVSDDMRLLKEKLKQVG